MHWLLLVPCVAVVTIVWDTFLAIILRPWIQLPLLGWNRKEGKIALDSLNAKNYILLVGVLQWGWACFLGFTLFDYLSAHYWGEYTIEVTPLRLLRALLVWSLVGIGFGWMQRRSSRGIERYEKPDSLIH